MYVEFCREYACPLLWKLQILKNIKLTADLLKVITERVYQALNNNVALDIARIFDRV